MSAPISPSLEAQLQAAESETITSIQLPATARTKAPHGETQDQVQQLSARLQGIFQEGLARQEDGESSSSSSRNSVRSTDTKAASTPALTTASVSTPRDSEISTPSNYPAAGGDTYFAFGKKSVGKLRLVNIRNSGSATQSTRSSSSGGRVSEEKLEAEPTDHEQADESDRPAILRGRSSSHVSARSRSLSIRSVQEVGLDVARAKSTPPSNDRADSDILPAVRSLDWFEPSVQPKDLILPTGPAAPVSENTQQPRSLEDLEAGLDNSRATVQDEVEAEASPANSTASRASSWARTKAWYKRVYAPTESPPLVLPTAPTDEEKALYLKTNRLGLHGLGVLAFLSLSAGMWLFVISSAAFYWFGAFVVFLQIYMIVSYLTSICGGEFDFEGHQKTLQENPIDPVTAPMIDVYLPVCMEPMEILENTWNHIKALQWPEGKLKVWVLDDGASDAVKELATSEKFGFNYILRDNRPHLKKAGNLRYAFARTEAPFFTIFDADFCPRPDFLQEIMPEHMAHPDTCIVQTPQFFRTTSEQSWVEQGAGAVQEVFYRVVQTNRNKWGASVCVGSNAVYRRESLLEVGGTAEIGFSEDVHTGFYAMCRGWKLRYMPLNLACGVCPDTPRAYFSQQMRWAMGSTTLVTNPEFWKSPLNRMQKICFLCGLLYYSAISLSIFLAPLPGMLLIWIRPEYVRYYNLAFAVPSVLFGVLVVRAWAKAEYGWNVNFVQQVQMYAYLAALKKRMLGRGLTWVASGDNKVHKSNEFREMRIVAWVWNLIILGLIVSGIVYQTVCKDALRWYDTIPLIALTLFNLFLAHRFLLWGGKI